MLYGVDVHGKYQAGLSFETLARQGYTFAAVKASQGTSFVGPNFAPWIAAGRKAGLIMGAYHWISRGNAVAQCDHFLSVLAAVGGPDGLLIQLDCEDDATLADVQAWVARWNQRTKNHPLLVYTGAWWWGAAGRRWNGASLTPYLWNSHYLTADADVKPDDPAAFAGRVPASWWAPGYGGWGTSTILQFTSRGDAGSLGNNVDLNATRLSREQLLALTRPPTIPVPVPAPAKETDMQPTDQLVVPPWMKERWTGDPGLQDGKIAVQTTLVSGYGHARAGREAAEQAQAAVAGLAATVDGLVAALAAMSTGGTSVDTAAVIAAVRDVGAQVTDVRAQLADAERERDELRERLALALAPPAG